MTETEHLLACLAEEAGEIIQACGKALRFGLTDGYPGTDRTNAGDIATELAHLKAVADMLNLKAEKIEGTLMEEKTEKVRKFMVYARRIGTLESESDKPSSEPSQPPQLVDGFPRRNRIDLFTPVEEKIWEAVDAVESSGAHPLLTDAVVLLNQARDKVADFVELPATAPGEER